MQRIFNSSFIAICCAVLVSVLALPSTALAQQKTAKQCNDEWTENKASIQASGKTKKNFVTECRAGTTSSSQITTQPKSTAPPTPASGQKSAKQCNDEWTTNKASIQSSGKTKRAFIAECRTGQSTASAPIPQNPPAQQQTRTNPSAGPAAAPQSPLARTAPAQVPSTAPGARASVGSPRGPGEFATEIQAKNHCPTDTVVWANLESKIYHYSGTRNYGTTKNGAYMCEKETATAGMRAAENEKRP